MDGMRTFFSIYAPTLQADEETAMTFHETLPPAVALMQIDHNLFIVDNFNASVGKDFVICEVLSRNDVGKVNTNC